MIRLERVSKSLGGDVVISDVSMQCLFGQTTVLLGPSGCGKSTLLRLILGLISPDSGQIFISQKPLTKLFKASRPILTGIRLDDYRLILEGAVRAALMTLLVQWGFDTLELVFVPKRLRLKREV